MLLARNWSNNCGLWALCPLCTAVVLPHLAIGLTETSGWVRMLWLSVMTSTVVPILKARHLRSLDYRPHQRSCLDWSLQNLRGHSKTMWTRFWPFLATHPPHMDKYGHFIHHLPISMWTFKNPPNPNFLSRFRPFWSKNGHFGGFGKVENVDF